MSQEKAAKLKTEGKGFGYGRSVRRLGATIAALEEDMDKLEKVFPQVQHEIEANFNVNSAADRPLR